MKTPLLLPTDLVLASASPRRHHLLGYLGIDFRVVVHPVDESIVAFDGDPALYVSRLAQLKAEAVAQDCPGSIVIGADTTVYVEGRVLNKPNDSEEARQMLRNLSGNTHTVYTGVAVLWGRQSHSFFEATHVTFRELDDSEIEWYISSGSPFDKAGSYGIQDDFGATFIAGIRGCFYNVVGLPLSALYKALQQLASHDAIETEHRG